jgi:hypothetical protein
VREALDNAVANGHEVWKFSARANAQELQRHDADLEDESIEELTRHAQAWLDSREARWLDRMLADVPPEIMSVYTLRRKTVERAQSKGDTQWRITSSSGKSVVWKRTNNPAKPWRIGL